jgi:hypothetical protein
LNGLGLTSVAYKRHLVDAEPCVTGNGGPTLEFKRDEKRARSALSCSASGRHLNVSADGIASVGLRFQCRQADLMIVTANISRDESYAQANVKGSHVLNLGSLNIQTSNRFGNLGFINA